MTSGSQPSARPPEDSRARGAMRPAEPPVTPPARERPPVPPRPGEEPPATAQGRPRIPRWAMWLIFLVVILAWNIFLFVPFGGPSSAAIPYSEFVTQATSGNIASVQ